MWTEEHLRIFRREGNGYPTGVRPRKSGSHQTRRWSEGDSNRRSLSERGYGKTFYFHDPNGIRLQIELKTKQDADSLEGDPDPVPYVRALLQRA